jgi:hypothetical protein
MPRIATSAVFILAGCRCLAAQSAPAQPTLAQLTPAIRSFFHDSAEFPLAMQVSVVATNSAGRVVEKKSGKGQFNFRGYNPRTQNAQSDMRISTNLVPVAVNIFVAIGLPSNVLSRVAGERYSLEVGEKESAGGLLTVKIPQLPDCSEFKGYPKKHAPRPCAEPTNCRYRKTIRVYSTFRLRPAACRSRPL